MRAHSTIQPQAKNEIISSTQARDEFNIAPSRLVIQPCSANFALPGPALNYPLINQKKFQESFPVFLI